MFWKCTWDSNDWRSALVNRLWIITLREKREISWPPDLSFPSKGLTDCQIAATVASCNSPLFERLKAFSQDPTAVSGARAHARTHTHTELKLIIHIFHISATRFVCMNGLTTNKHQPAGLYICLFVCLLEAASLVGWFVGWLHGWLVCFVLSFIGWLTWFVLSLTGSLVCSLVCSFPSWFIGCWTIWLTRIAKRVLLYKVQ